MFFCFLVYMIAQFRLVGVQYDDYGYYTLNYGVEITHSGTNYSFSELFRFLGEHYHEVTGRLLYIAIWLIIYKLGGLTAVQIAAAVTVTTVFYLLYHIGSSAVKNASRFGIYGAVILCLCYGSMDIEFHRHGTYWYSAFYTYYMPMVTTELFVLCYEKFHDRLAWKHMPILVLLAFASAWSGETWSVGVVSLMLVLFARECWNKKGLDIKHLLLVGVSATGLMILLKSPGIQHRAGDRQWGFTNLEIYGNNIKTAFSTFFSAYNRRYLLFLLAGCCMLAVILYLQRHAVVDIICAAGTAVMTMITFVDRTLLQDTIVRTPGTAFFCIGIVMLSILVPVCRYYYFKADGKRAMLLFASAMSIASLAGVPEVQLRVYIPFEVCSFLIVFDACHEMYENVVRKKIHFDRSIYRWGIIAAFVLYVLGMTGLSVRNYVRIYSGYRENAVIDQYNDVAWVHAKEQIARGDEVSAVYLKKFVDDTYATITLYQQEWFKVYIDRYYEIPDEVEYIYEE